MLLELATREADFKSVRNSLAGNHTHSMSHGLSGLRRSELQSTNREVSLNLLRNGSLVRSLAGLATFSAATRMLYIH